MADNWWEAAPKAKPSVGGGNWWDSAPPADSVPNFPGKNASFSQGKPESMWHSAWESVRNSFFGSPERRDVEAINAELEKQGKPGVGLTPTPAQMVEGGLTMAAMMGGPTAIVGQLPRIARGTKAAQFVATHPGIANAAFGAIPGLLDQSPKEALGGAITGGVLAAGIPAAPALLRKAPDAAKAVWNWGVEHPNTVKTALGAIGGGIHGGEKEALAGAAAVAILNRFGGDKAGLRKMLKELAEEGRNEEVQAIVQALRKAESGAPAAVVKAAESEAAPAVAASKLKRPGFVEGAVRAPEDPNAYTKGFPAGQKPALEPREPLTYPREGLPPTVKKDPGREAAERHARAMAIAKEAAKSHPKIGQKIWIKFKDGQPIGVIVDTEKSAAYDLAGAINRGTKKTGESAQWFRNLWGDASKVFGKLDD